MRHLLTRDGGATRLRVAFLVGAAAVIAVSFAVVARSAGLDPTEFAPSLEPDAAVTDRQVPGNQSPAHVSAAFVPRPTPLAVGSPAGIGTNFNGINFHIQRRIADGGNQLSLEPPDQGLCVGNGSVLEAVNDTFAVYNTAGTRVSSYQSLNQLFAGDHAIVRSPTLVFGTFISDPKCYYDTDSGRWFFTVLTIPRNPSTGALQGHSDVRIAVSKSSTPTANVADWTITTIDTTNEFSLFGNGFNGAQVYAVQKSALVAGTTPAIQRIEGSPIASSYGDGPPYSLQPATSPSVADYATSSNGTEYLLGALEFGKNVSNLDNRIAVWALTNTASLNTKPAIAIDDAVITSQVYGLPGAIVQPDGPTPFADSLREHENLLDGGDDRMQAATYAHGVLWGAGDTVVKTPTGSTQVGVTYYAVTPAVSGSTVSGSVVKQGYLSVEKASVTRPSLAVTSAGRGVIGVSLIGDTYYPSAAYATIDDTLATAPSTLSLVARGVAPADGFSGYHTFGSDGVERWGDYGAASADGNSVWIANEWIEGTRFGAEFANWSTYVTQVTP